MAIVSAVVISIVRPSTNDGIARENPEVSAYLEAHGYDISRAGIRSEASTPIGSTFVNHDGSRNDFV